VEKGRREAADGCLFKWGKVLRGDQRLSQN
jgi:hypothetical protein